MCNDAHEPTDDHVHIAAVTPAQMRERENAMRANTTTITIVSPPYFISFPLFGFFLRSLLFPLYVYLYVLYTYVFIIRRQRRRKEEKDELLAYIFSGQKSAHFVLTLPLKSNYNSLKRKKKRRGKKRKSYFLFLLLLLLLLFLPNTYTHTHTHIHT